MSNLFSLGASSTRVAVSNTVATSWSNTFTDSVQLRVTCDISMHIRVVKNNGTDEALSSDFPLFANDDVVLNVAKDEHLSFLGYTPTPGVKESGSLVFLARANDSDTITINDGSHSAVVFTFGDGTSGTVNKGSSAIDSATNLKAAIAAKVLANLLSVSVGRFSNELLIANDLYTGGTLSQGGSGVSGRITLVNFAGGESPNTAPDFHSGSAWVTKV